MLKEGERTSQRICMNDPWTWTMVWGLTVGAGDGLGGGGQRWINWDNCNRINKNNIKRGLVGQIILSAAAPSWVKCVHLRCIG